VLGPGFSSIGVLEGAANIRHLHQMIEDRCRGPVAHRSADPDVQSRCARAR